MSAMVDLGIEQQHAEIDAAIWRDAVELDAALTGTGNVASLVRIHRETGVIDCGPCNEYRVWYAEDRGGRNLFGVLKKHATYTEAVREVGRAIEAGAGVVTVDFTVHREWHQEVWAQRPAVAS